MLSKRENRASARRSGRTLHSIALAALLAALVPAGSAGAATPRAEVPGPSSTVRVDAAAGELEDGTIVVHGARGRLSAHLEPGAAPLLLDSLAVLRLTTTRVDGREIGDPLPTLSQELFVRAGSKVRLVLRFRVPDGTPAGVYDGRLAVASNGRRFASVPVRLRVFGVQMPARDDPAAFRTLFLIQPQTYVAAVLRGSGIEPQSAGVGVTDRLYAFLSDYRISPGDWGFGTPWPDGYQDRAGWWRAAATRMAAEGAYPFCTMRLPLGTQRSSRSRTGQSARRPGTWTAYLSERVLPVLARSRLARPSARLGMGRAGARLRPPLRGAAGVCSARRRRGVSHDGRTGAAHPCPARVDPVGAGHARLHDPGARHGQRVPVGRPRMRRRRHLGRALAALLRLLRDPRRAPRAHRHRSASCGPRSVPRAHGERRSGASPTSPWQGAALRATRPPSPPRTRGCSGSGTPSRAWTERSTPTAWRATAASIRTRRLAQHGQHVLVYPALASTDEPVLVPAPRERPRRHRGRRPGAARRRPARRRGAARHPRAPAHLLHPRAPCAARAARRAASSSRRRSTPGPATATMPGTRAALERVHTALLEALAPAPA